VIGFLVLLSQPATAEGEVRLSIKVRDEAGEPVPKLKISMMPVGDDDYPTRSVTTNKKGSATIPNLSPSSYRPKLESDTYRIVSIAYTARRSDGSHVADFSEDNVRERGVPTMVLASFSRGEMQLVVAEAPVGVPDENAVGLAGLSDTAGDLARLNALFDLGKWDELLEQSEASLAADPDLGGAHYLRGVALWRTGRLDEGVQHLRKACELIPDQPGVHGVLAALLLEWAAGLRGSGRVDEALEATSEAVEQLRLQLETTPGSTADLTNLVIALESLGRTEEAVGALSRMIELNPEDGRPYLRKADLLLELGDAEGAIRTLEMMPGAGQEVVGLLYNAGVEFWNDGDLEATVATMHKVIERDPANAEAHRLLGRALIAAGRQTEGVAALKEFLRLAPDDASAEVERQLVERLSQPE
jgi:tetratricopeptide (TPR) repeat protein